MEGLVKVEGASDNNCFICLVCFKLSRCDNIMATLQQITSERGKPLLVLNKFKYYKKDILKTSEVKWCCISKLCTAKLYTIGEGADRVLTRKHDLHNHEPESEKKLQKQFVSTSVKRRATEDISSKPSKVFCGVLRELAVPNLLLDVSDKSCIKRNAYNARRKKYPILPRCVEDVHSALDSQLWKTSSGENFLLVNSSSDKIVIFSCITNLSILCTCETIYVDGTFSYCTRYFKQLFTIHGYKDGHYLPLVFCLLNDKYSKTYENCFKHVVDQCRKNGLLFKPSKITIDFEKAIHNAVNCTWPNVEIVGCRFHLSQSWFRKIQELGLVKEYKNKDSNVGKFLKYTFGLQYLQPNEVGDCIAFDLAAIQPDDERISVYLDYLIDNYVSETAVFPPEIWAAASSDLCRTTNACESFHARFNQNFHNSKPSLYIFMDTLIDFQMDTYVRINSVKSGNNSVSKKNKKIQHVDLRLNLYKSNTINRLEFIKNVCHHFGDIVNNV